MFISPRWHYKYQMHYDFAVKFQNSPELYVRLHDSDLARDWLYLFYLNYQREIPLFRDQGSYSLSRMKQLAYQCKHVLGWDWIHNDYDDFEVTTSMHKDLEQYLAKGFSGVPSEHDSLLHELHICLHSTQQRNLRTTMQLEWFNDDGFSLEGYDFKFSHDSTLGSIWLQNPYVGHPPDWIWQQNDHINVWQTCRFHDFVRPGLVINMLGSLEPTIKQFNHQAYLDWWNTTASDFVKHHGVDKMLANTGHPVIGQIVNNKALLPLQHMATLKFEYIRFADTAAIKPIRQHFAPVFAINQTDYENVAGPDWPSYDQFQSDPVSFPSVRAEIHDMTDIKI